MTLDEGIENEIIQKTLLDAKELKQIFGKLIKAWRAGDSKALDKLANDDLRVYPEVYQKMLVGRNNNWFPKVKRFLKSAEKEFVLVGVAHLVSKDGLIEMLKSQGYKVQQL